MIECRNVSKRFGDFVALDNVSLDIPSGIFALIGPNGAGKSTLLKMLTGLLRPDTGSIIIAGMDISVKPIDVRRVIGVVPEDLGLLDSLTVFEHLQLTGPIYGLSHSETSSRAETLLRILGLHDARDRFAEDCSHGMKKKLALAMALLPQPRVLFLDEPFEAIDPVSAATIESLLKNVAAAGATIFLTSHVLTIVDRLATEVQLIRQGRIVWRSAAEMTRRDLEQVYFDLVEPPSVEECAWPPSSRS